ncbi:trypsin-like serine peptidase [Ponticoccus sp. (in: a-proteobacteria)]|uniref:trypsin-like serine peptidase n=1 Tax=Ponticoccus sp. (in: a-proteobacteria) TaxID=1925025 RepID=UPI003AB24B58
MRLLPSLACLALTCGGLATGGLAGPQAGIDNEVAIEGYNNEPISTYSAEADFVKLGRGVGLLRIETDGGTFPCTAFLVSETHLLTNNHCVPGVLEHPDVTATEILSVTWMAGYTHPGMIEEAESFDVDVTPVETSQELDYTVLRVRGDPASRYPVLPLTDAVAKEGMPYWIIGHPKGESQRISREGCRAARPPSEGNRLRHTCDTLGGNSGSPIFDSSARQVIGLHNAGNDRVGINFGVPMALILGQSGVLKATAAAAPKPLPLVMSLYPEVLGVGEELSVAADVPADCTPLFYDVAPSGRLVPLPSEIFQQVTLSALQTRFQTSPAAQYGLVVVEEDEKGTHRLGFACGPEDQDVRQWLRPVIERVMGGTLVGEVAVTGGTASFAFRAFTVR